ncbi:MoaD/ThiS family protein [Aquirufa aurantiipilula]|uniref:MoaD/ThiS family protein n=1 Tax=Aquirufa aurantiipilula TaxID=2696561 RepID=A0ABT6BGU5_9BACT|nr:MoaD/ThiS family protein [Aquirufa aurantiipilula]MDF5689562.1 MoaD/ThiS family protein [Aquirufa aurantiipilula]
MPNYRILLFGLTRDLLQNKEIVVSTNKILTASQLLDQLKSNYPSLANLPSLRIAAEHHFPEANFILQEGMEIALIPPVSGG